jgi:hypothetical protein
VAKETFRLWEQRFLTAATTGQSDKGDDDCNCCCSWQYHEFKVGKLSYTDIDGGVVAVAVVVVIDDMCGRRKKRSGDLAVGGFLFV